MKLGKIRIEYHREPEEVVITADADGLRYLKEVCSHLMGNTGPAAHWHLMEKMNNVEAGSINTSICRMSGRSDLKEIRKYLKIEYRERPEEIVILAGDDGLSYLGDVFTRLIGKSGPAAHWHLMPNMDNVEEGSIDTRIIFSP